jgi:hypothetical protein
MTGWLPAPLMPPAAIDRLFAADAADIFAASDYAELISLSILLILMPPIRHISATLRFHFRHDISLRHFATLLIFISDAGFTPAFRHIFAITPL